CKGRSRARTAQGAGRTQKGVNRGANSQPTAAVRTRADTVRRRRGKRFGERRLCHLRRPAVVAFDSRRTGMHALPPAGGGRIGGRHGGSAGVMRGLLRPPIGAGRGLCADRRRTFVFPRGSRARGGRDNSCSRPVVATLSWTGAFLVSAN